MFAVRNAGGKAGDCCLVGCRGDVVKLNFEIVEIKIIAVFIEKFLAYFFEYCAIAEV